MASRAPTALTTCATAESASTATPGVSSARPATGVVDGGWWICVSDPEWCVAHPAPGRESVERGTIEWFEIARRPSEGEPK